MQIGPKSIEKVKMMMAEQLDSYAGKINEAFLKSEDGYLRVSIALDFEVSKTKSDGIDVDVTISFVADRIKEKVSDTVVENQLELEGVKIYPLKDTR